MGYLKEFKEFAIKGNAIDLAVGIIIGAAFGKIITSLVEDIIMPPIGFVTNGIDFSKLKAVLKPADESHKVAEVAVKYGNFINNILQFLIIAFCVFLIVKLFNKLRKKQEVIIVIPPPTKEEALLTDIRDILKNQSK